MYFCDFVGACSSRFECYLVLQRAEAAHEASKSKAGDGAFVTKAKVKPPPAFLGGPREKPSSHDHATDERHTLHAIDEEAGARETGSRSGSRTGSRAGSRVGTPGGAGGATGGANLLLGKCGFWNPLVGLKVLQKLTDALAAAEAEDLAKASSGAASKQNTSRSSSRRNSREPLSPHKEPLSPHKEPLSPQKEPLSPKTSKEPLSAQKEPLSPKSPGSAASGKSTWTPKAKASAGAAAAAHLEGSHHHPVQFIYAQAVSLLTLSIDASEKS